MTKRCTLTAQLLILESIGKSKDRHQRTINASFRTPHIAKNKKKPDSRASQSRIQQLLTPRFRQTLAALGHSARLRILETLLESPATYQTLKNATGLAAGPLYFHINQLRLAALILPKERNLYEITRGGRNLLALVLVGSAAISDTRPRPKGG